MDHILFNQLMDIWSVCTLGLLWIMLSWTLVYSVHVTMFLPGHVYFYKINSEGEGGHFHLGLHSLTLSLEDFLFQAAIFHPSPRSWCCMAVSSLAHAQGGHSRSPHQLWISAGEGIGKASGLMMQTPETGAKDRKQRGSPYGELNNLTSSLSLKRTALNTVCRRHHLSSNLWGVQLWKVYCACSEVLWKGGISEKERELIRWNLSESNAAVLIWKKSCYI